MLESYTTTFRKISQTQIGLGITLDLLLHFLFGLLITTTLRKFRKWEFWKIFLVLLIAALMKEILDIQAMRWTLKSSIADLIATFVYPMISITIYKFKMLLEAEE